MRQLLPNPAPDVSVASVYGEITERAAALAGRPYLALNMVSSADGAISVDGVSAGLSGSADKEVFFYLRSLADVILVGSATVRAENYGQPKLSAELIAERVARGQAPLPRIAVVTRSMELDWSARLFTELAGETPVQRPQVICPRTAPKDRCDAAARVADLILAGETDVDFKDAAGQMSSSGVRFVLCEGGPTLNGQLLSAGVVDELCLTVSPSLVGGSGSRISGWKEAHQPLPLELLTLTEVEGVLMFRYGVGSE